LQHPIKKGKTNKQRKSISKPQSKYDEADLVPQQTDNDDLDYNGELPRFIVPLVETINIGVTTGCSYVSGGFSGYLFGATFGVRRLMKQSSTVSTGWREEFKKRATDWNGNSMKRAGEFAEWSAAGVGFHALSKAIRGGKEDKWNAVISAAATGAYLSRKAGRNAMVQGGLNYAAITYVFDRLLSTGTQGKIQQNVNNEAIAY